MDILGQLGIDGRILVAQLVNFAILLFLLHRFLYNPIVGILQKRTETIEKSIADARALEERMKASELMQQQMMEKTRAEASEIIEQAMKLAEQKRTSALKKAKEDVQQIVVDAREKINIEKEQMLLEAREQFAELVVTAAKSVLTEGSDKHITPELVKKVLAKVKQT